MRLKQISEETPHLIAKPCLNLASTGAARVVQCANFHVPSMRRAGEVVRRARASACGVLSCSLWTLGVRAYKTTLMARIIRARDGRLLLICFLRFLHSQRLSSTEKVSRVLSESMLEGATLEEQLTARLTPGVRYHVARGDSLVESGGPSYHTLRYAFKPDSVSHATNGSIHLGTSGAVKMHVQTGGARAVHFEGNVEPHKLTEFVLLRDSDGSLRLERLSQNVKNLKVVRDAAKATAPELTPEAVAQLKARAARGARVTQAPRVTPAKRAAAVAVEAAPEQSSDDDNVDTAQLFGDEDEVVS